jgi:hypothetical protein
MFFFGGAVPATHTMGVAWFLRVTALDDAGKATDATATSPASRIGPTKELLTTDEHGGGSACLAGRVVLGVPVVPPAVLPAAGGTGDARMPVAVRVLARAVDRVIGV